MGDIRVPVTDLRAIHSGIHEEIVAAVEMTLSSSRFILGPEVKEFETEFAGYVNSQFAAGVASGTDALYIALSACGVGPGDEVITTPFSFIASSECIERCGAKPVFVDIDAVTYNIDPAGIEEKITSRTAAMVIVHLYGKPAELRNIMEIGRKYNLKVIEDCAQSLGAEYDGQRVGSIGTAGCFSFFPAKILGAHGDGGMVVTDDEEIAQECDAIRKHGCRKKYFHHRHGLNSRLDALQAAVLRVKLKHLDRWISQRIEIAERYKEALDSLPIRLPVEDSSVKHVFNYYTISVPERRDELQRYLSENGIGTAVYYPLSLHLQEVYSELGYRKGDFPNSEKAQQKVLSLPMYPGMTREEIDFVTDGVRSFFRD